jgi:hypothetical protein
VLGSLKERHYFQNECAYGRIKLILIVEKYVEELRTGLNYLKVMSKGTFSR